MLMVSFVRPEHVGMTWPLIKTFVTKVCDISGGRRTPLGVLTQLIDGDAQLWVAHDEQGSVQAFATTRICKYDAVTMLCLEMISGLEVDDWMTDENIQMFIRFAEDNGCSGIEGWGRGRAWARKLKHLHWNEFSTGIEIRWD